MKATEKYLVDVVGAARPNFMKIAPLYHALHAREELDVRIVHTGQHYDSNMSGDFFRDLGMPEPHLRLEVGSGSHGEQTGRTLMAYEKTLMQKKPDLTVVVGDVNATLACTLASVKLGVPVAHLEAGLRSFDRTMPEEINRLATDVLADILWTPSSDADENLAREGVDPARIEMVGNIMIDSLEMMRPAIEALGLGAKMGLEPRGYGVVTLHRPATVDHKDRLLLACRALSDLSRKLPLVFPVHPRTQKQLDAFGLWNTLKGEPGIILLEPLSYIPFMSLVMGARLAATDSGGLQEETTYLGIPCLTLRPNTERPVTITLGTNKLCTLEDLYREASALLEAPPVPKEPPPLWDGHTATRVCTAILRFVGKKRN